jgi:uncharacterized membrane protein
MFMMIQGHTFDALASPHELDINNFPWSLWAYLRRYTSPMFLMVSGAVQVFANKRNEQGKLDNNTIWRRIKIALILIAVGYMFNCPVSNAFDLFYIDSKSWIPFLQIGILQIIGVSLISVLLVFLLTKNDKSLGITSFIIATTIIFSSAFVHNIRWFQILPESLASYISFDHGSGFTVFPYMGFMFSGVTYGTLLKQIAPDKRIKFILYSGIPIGLIFIFLGFQFYPIYTRHFFFDVVMKANPGIIFNQIGTVFIVLSFAALVFTLTKKLAFYYSFFGKKALFIYITHLFLIYGTPWSQGIGKIYNKSLPLGITFIIVICVEVASFAIAYLYEYSQNKFPYSKKIYRYILIGVILYFLVIGRLVLLLS